MDTKHDSKVMWWNIGGVLGIALLAGIFNDMNPRIMQFVGIGFFTSLWVIFFLNLPSIIKDVVKTFKQPFW